MKTGRSTIKLIVLGILSTYVIFCSCSKETKEKIYYYHLRTISATGLEQSDEEMLLFKVDSLNTEYHKVDMRGKGNNEDLTIKTFELGHDRYEQDIKKCIFDKIRSGRIEMSLGVYHAEDKRASDPIAEMIFKN